MPYYGWNLQFSSFDRSEALKQQAELGKMGAKAKVTRAKSKYKKDKDKIVYNVWIWYQFRGSPQTFERPKWRTKTKARRKQ